MKIITQTCGISEWDAIGAVPGGGVRDLAVGKAASCHATSVWILAKWNHMRLSECFWKKPSIEDWNADISFGFVFFQYFSRELLKPPWFARGRPLSVQVWHREQSSWSKKKSKWRGRWMELDGTVPRYPKTTCQRGGLPVFWIFLFVNSWRVLQEITRHDSDFKGRLNETLKEKRTLPDLSVKDV